MNKEDELKDIKAYIQSLILEHHIATALLVRVVRYIKKQRACPNWQDVIDPDVPDLFLPLETLLATLQDYVPGLPDDVRNHLLVRLTHIALAMNEAALADLGESVSNEIDITELVDLLNDKPLFRH